MAAVSTHETTEQAPLRQIVDRYIACETLKVGSDKNGNAVCRYAGEEIPEAARWHWTIRESYITNGRIRIATIGSTDEFKRGPGRPFKER